MFLILVNHLKNILIKILATNLKTLAWYPYLLNKTLERLFRIDSNSILHLNKAKTKSNRTHALCGKTGSGLKTLYRLGDTLIDIQV